MRKKYFISIIAILVVSYIINIYYYKRSNDIQSEIKPLRLQCDDFLTVNLLLEILKKEKLSKEQMIELFTFHDKCLISFVDLTDLPLEICEKDTIDISNREVYHLQDLDILFLFENNVLVEYCYKHSHREFMKIVLQRGSFNEKEEVIHQ